METALFEPQPPAPRSRRYGPRGLVPNPTAVPRFDIAGLLRRARRHARMSQRDMAEAIGVSQSTIARAERDSGSVRVPVLLAVLAIGGIELIATDADGEVFTMRTDELRDRGGRQLPAHLHAHVATHDEIVPQHWVGARRRNSVMRWTMRDPHQPWTALPLYHPGPEDLVRACRDDRVGRYRSHHAPCRLHTLPPRPPEHPDQALPTHSSEPSVNT